MLAQKRKRRVRFTRTRRWNASLRVWFASSSPN
jgi:hypothetical protein